MLNFKITGFATFTAEIFKVKFEKEFISKHKFFFLLFCESVNIVNFSLCVIFPKQRDDTDEKTPTHSTNYKLVIKFIQEPVNCWRVPMVYSYALKPHDFLISC